MSIKSTLYIGCVLGGAFLLSSCASISEDECLAGNWEDRGYRDGLNGEQRSLITDYVDTCSKYGADVNRQSYATGYESGLTYYCVPEKGFALGRNGSSYNTVCTGPSSEGFHRAYEDGRAEYRIESEHKRLINALNETEDEIDDVRRRLKDDELSDEEYKRLRKKRDRLEDERQAIRRDLADFERANGLDRSY